VAGHGTAPLALIRTHAPVDHAVRHSHQELRVQFTPMRRRTLLMAFLAAVVGIASYACLDATMKILVLQVGTVTA
jgi:hypothetical protein